MIAWLLAVWKFIDAKAEEYLVIAILSLAVVLISYFVGYERGKTSAQLQQAKETIKTVTVTKVVHDKINALPVGAADSQLLQHWSR